ncbi:MAG: transposase [Betaproteobacteria bacterium HGW-Betaproteobacteria-7]|jgi:putative transposase|nr:MAG: transposase [Betaproteobacteria bacterium HGW-Betaproteobacteria-7]
MPRRPRVLLSGYPLHIVQRGINREPCFFTDEDYHCYLHWLEESARACGCAIHAYALMTNHVHLLITPEKDGGPSRLMQSLGRRYVQYANRFYRRTGSLWEGRYKSSVVQAENYLVTCQRYIELNPVRAGMVVDPGQYRWSSYRANGLGEVDARLTPHKCYLSLGQGDGERQAAYRALFRPELEAEAINDIRKALQSGMPLGNERFAETICGNLGIRHNTGKRGRPNRAVDEKRALPITEQQDFGF